MRKLLDFFIILALFSSAATAAEISGSVVSDGKKLAGLPVELSKINGTTQSDQSMAGVVNDFIKLSEITTDKNGSSQIPNTLGTMISNLPNNYLCSVVNLQRQDTLIYALAAWFFHPNSS